MEIFQFWRMEMGFHLFGMISSDDDSEIMPQL